MTTTRAYRRALTREEAIAELIRGAGTQFDSDMVKVFIECLHDISVAAERAPVLTSDPLATWPARHLGCDMNFLTAYAPPSRIMFLRLTRLIAFFCFLLAAIMLDFFDVSLPDGGQCWCCRGVECRGACTRRPAESVSGYRCGLGSCRPRVAPWRAITSSVGGGACLARQLLAGTLFLSQYRDTAPALAVYCLVPAIFLAVEMMAAQAVTPAMTWRPYLRLLRGDARSQAPVLTAEWSAYSPAAPHIQRYRGGTWSLALVALLLLMRQSFALFLDIQETYRATVEVFVEAAESQDARRGRQAVEPLRRPKPSPCAWGSTLRRSSEFPTLPCSTTWDSR